MAKSKTTTTTPLEACIRLERILRGTDAYHIALDHPKPYGLGRWLKRVIRSAKKGSS